ncbi:MAG: type VI secretion system ImpA family N-terminal domain-containing protein [Chitinispirillales bacterium]|jgi:type VI secretion system protein VasJ|nr:type VI secretion system ImpA family N-terminal domain-containing protein [Chitinispirillales bacterium]
MSDFLSTITAPISGDPFGSDVNHDVDYEALKVEMGKLGDIDVSAVESLSVRILAEKSKDVRALSFLAYAMLRVGDHGRLADVFCVLADYCHDSYDKIFPTRDGAKLSALRWLSEARFTSVCPRTDASTQDAEHVARLLAALLKLRAALEKRFSSVGAPFPLLLYKRALEWESSVKSALKAEAETVSTYAGATSVSGADGGLVLAEPAGQTAGAGDKSFNRPVGKPADKNRGVGIDADRIKEVARCLKRIAEVLEGGI